MENFTVWILSVFFSLSPLLSKVLDISTLLLVAPRQELGLGILLSNDIEMFTNLFTE